MLLPGATQQQHHHHQYDSADALRMRSRELLDMLRGSHPASQSQPSLNHPYPSYPSSASVHACDPFYVGGPAAAPSTASTSTGHLFPEMAMTTTEPYHGLPSAAAAASSSSSSAPQMTSPWSTASAVTAAATANSARPSTDDKMLINEMYSSNLRALLKIDVRA
ncbi:hypothetical protein SYNPS1DRAFT_28719 [Syncephalis pseudoplumigaleata]|uniref:Uncharacterized protein n=1 Tax=Syncephalis pseudoplumigaleata TaxID=1712513 RepID=A0A4V1J1M2_9FUNG|nr:hypothetical protein SYNPS1DRAFT_28719 [Syncephalis pseudoplumigaleata]|eukprot:RKP25549.1 hypothetical protein SYNPS1DRAFT_28719 [Syncephalis pseudoplumigaleata]